MWELYRNLSIISLAFFVLVSIGIRCIPKKKYNVFNWLFAGVVLASVFIFVPYHTVSGDVKYGFWQVALLSVFNAIQMFPAGCDYVFTTEKLIATCPVDLISGYQAWAAFLYVLAPLFTFGFILSMFRNLLPYLRYIWFFFRDVYVFSELNEKSVAFASDIKNKHPKAVIVFTDIFDEDKERIFELIEQTKTIGSINFKKDILAIKFNIHSPTANIFFFAIGENEAENINQSHKLIENYKDRWNMRLELGKKDDKTTEEFEAEETVKKSPNTHLYVFSSKIESEIILNTINKGSMRVRRINEVQSLVNRFLLEKGTLLFDSAKADNGGNKRISAVVIGMGNHGTEFVKALAWYGQMDGYAIKINAFDKDPLAEEKFTALAPELMNDDYNGVYIDGEAQYDITIHSATDVHTKKFADEIQKIDDATFVIVALGDDHVNINTAVNMRMYFERMKIYPVIYSITYNPQQKKALEGIVNFNDQKYDIEFFGDTESLFTEDVIINSQLEEEALQRHLKWGGEDKFWNFEYNYRSSVASALHMKARIHCGIPGADKQEDKVTEEEDVVIQALEHRRWNAYMRAEGYVYSGSKKKESRNHLAKMHHSLVDYSSLSDEDKKKDGKIGTK